MSSAWHAPGSSPALERESSRSPTAHLTLPATPEGCPSGVPSQSCSPQPERAAQGFNSKTNPGTENQCPVQVVGQTPGGEGTGGAGISAAGPSRARSLSPPSLSLPPFLPAARIWESVLQGCPLDLTWRAMGVEEESVGRGHPSLYSPKNLSSSVVFELGLFLDHQRSPPHSICSLQPTLTLGIPLLGSIGSKHPH